MRKWLAPLVTVAIFAVLLGVVLTDRPSDTGEQEKQQLSIFSFPAEDIKEIHLQPAEGEAVVLRRQDEAWWVDPGNLKGNQVRIDYLADTLADLRATRRLAVPGELAAFGLDEPRLVVEITLQSGQQLALRVGDVSPVQTESGGEEYYVQARHAAPDVFILPGSVVDQMLATRNDFRNLYFARFSLADVRSFQVTREGVKIEVSRSARDADWQVTAPEPAPAATDKVTSFLDKVTFLEVKAYVRDNPTAADLAAHGLDRPLMELRVQLFEGAEEGQEIVVQIGRPTADGYYAWRPDEPYVYLVDKQTVEEELMIDPATFREETPE